jgi:hypothetical protein
MIENKAAGFRDPRNAPYAFLNHLRRTLEPHPTHVRRSSEFPVASTIPEAEHGAGFGPVVDLGEPWRKPTTAPPSAA